MQASKSHLMNIGIMLGLDLKQSLTTEQMLEHIRDALVGIHASLAVVWPASSRGANFSGCADRILALHTAASDRRARRR